MYEKTDEYKTDIDGAIIYTVPFSKSLPGIGFYFIGGLLVFINIILLFSKDGDFRVFCIIVPISALVAFLFSAKNLSYLTLSKDYLIVKKRFYFFTKDIKYENSNILEITFECIKHGKSEDNNIRIITKDLDISSFTMDLYKRRTFYDLKNALIGYGVNVIDNLNISQKEFMTFILP